MPEIRMVDVTLHIDESLDEGTRIELLEIIRDLNGVIGLGYHEEKPHLMIVEYNADILNSSEILAAIASTGIHAELIG